MPPGAANELCGYLARLLDQPVNVTAAKTLEAAVDVLVLPSLTVAGTWPRGVPPRRIVDVGSGNGFPGLVAACIWPLASVLLVERRVRKARAISACLGPQLAQRIDVASCDVRELKHDHSDWLSMSDLVLARAVASIAEVNALAAPLVSPGGRVVHWKDSERVESEREAGQTLARDHGLRPCPDVVPGDEHRRQRLIVFERIDAPRA